MKSGWLAFVAFAILFFYFGYLATSWAYSSQAQDAKDQLATSNGAKMEAERDRDKYQIEAQNAENALAPWKELATNQYPGQPINKSLNLLLQKVDALQKALADTATSPLEEPIASATATVDIDVKTDKPYAVGNNMGLGGFAAFVTHQQALLLAGTINNSSFATVAGQGKYEVIGTASIHDAYMGKPVKSLLDAQAIEIGINPGIVPDNTEVLDGTVTWVINNRITLTFPIPPGAMHVIQGNATLIFVNISDGLKPLTQPSSGSDTSTSQP